MRLRDKIKIKLQAKTILYFLKGLVKEGNNVRKRLIYYKLGKELGSKEAKPMVEGIRAKLKGKKTYLVAAVAILGALISFATGDIEAAKAIEVAIEAILATTIRAGIK